jgi:hypothetical protein
MADKRGGFQASGYTTRFMGVNASETIYLGDFVRAEANGLAEVADTDVATAGLDVIGVAKKQANNSAGADSAIDVEIAEKPKSLIVASTGLTIVDVGHPVSISDAQTVKAMANRSIGIMTALIATDLVEIDMTRRETGIVADIT